MRLTLANGGATTSFQRSANLVAGAETASQFGRLHLRLIVTVSEFVSYDAHSYHALCESS